MELGAAARRIVTRWNVGWIAHVVGGQVAQEIAHLEQTLPVVVGEKVGHAALCGMDPPATELFLADMLLHHRAHHLRSGDEHVALFGHEDEIGEPRRVDGPTGTGPQDG